MDIYELNDALRTIADAAGSRISDNDFDDLTHTVAKALDIPVEQ